MATATYKKGEKRSMSHTPSGADVVVDQIIVSGDSVCVAAGAIADGDTGIVSYSGVYEFPKVSGAVITAGDNVDWDVSAGEVDDNAATPASGDCSNFGVAIESAGNGVTTVLVELLPGRGTTA
jgi:predicted RecA/RadA family phage recombinase